MYSTNIWTWMAKLRLRHANQIPPAILGTVTSTQKVRTSPQNTKVGMNNNEHQQTCGGNEFCFTRLFWFRFRGVSFFVLTAGGVQRSHSGMILSMGNLGNSLVSIGNMLSWIDASIDNQFSGVDSWSKSKFTDASTSMGLKQIQVYWCLNIYGVEANPSLLMPQHLWGWSKSKFYRCLDTYESDR